MSANIIATEKVQIDPINAPPDSAFSFRGGYPIISFLIAQSDKYLVGKSLRLCGEFKITNGAGVAVKNNDGVGGGNGATRLNCSIDSRIGVASCLRQVTLSTLDNQTLEHIKEYPRLLSSLVPATHGGADLNNGNALGNITSSRSIVEACSLNTKRTFSIPIRCGLLSGTGLVPLGQNGTRGLIMNLECAPDASVLQPWLLGTATDPEAAESLQSGSVAGGVQIGDFSYTLSNVHLTYDLLVPDEEGAQMMNNASNGALQYNAYSSLYSVINSSDQTVSLNLGASKVQSIIHNIVPTTFVNNSQQLSNATYKLSNGPGVNAPILEVAYSKAGILFPRENRIDEQQKGVLGNEQSLIDAVTLETYLGAIKNINDLDNTLASCQTEIGKATRVNAVHGANINNPNRAIDDGGEDRWGMTLANKRPVFGLGIRQDIFKHGVDYSRTPYSVRVRSSLDGQNPNSLFTYVLASSTLLYSPEGIRVVS